MEIGRVYLKIVHIPVSLTEYKHYSLVLLSASPQHLRFTLHVMLFSSFTTLDLGSCSSWTRLLAVPWSLACAPFFLLLARMAALGEPMGIISLLCAASKSPVTLLAP